MTERLCKSCNLQLRFHSMIQLQSCESILRAKENFARMVQKGVEDRVVLEEKLQKKPKDKQ